MEAKSKSRKPKTGTKAGFTGNKKWVNLIGNVSVTIGYRTTKQEYQHIELRNLTSHTNLNNLAWQQHINNTNSYRKVHKI